MRYLHYDVISYPYLAAGLEMTVGDLDMRLTLTLIWTLFRQETQPPIRSRCLTLILKKILHHNAQIFRDW